MTTEQDLSKIWAETGGVTDPASPKYETGWIAEIPTYQNFNYVLQTTTKNILALAEKGAHAWDAAVLYAKNGSAVGSDGATYFCIVGHLNQDPVLDTVGAYWKLAPTLGIDLPDIASSKKGLLLNNVSELADTVTWSGHDQTIRSMIPSILMETISGTKNWLLGNIGGALACVDLDTDSAPDSRNIGIGEATTYKLFHEGNEPTQAQVPGTIPDANSDGLIYGRKNNNWIAVTTTTVSDTPPTSVTGSGTGWYNLLDGILYLDINDGDSSQWVPANAPYTYGQEGGGGIAESDDLTWTGAHQFDEPVVLGKVGSPGTLGLFEAETYAKASIAMQSSALVLSIAALDPTEGASELCARFVRNAGCTLYYNNIWKFIVGSSAVTFADDILFATGSSNTIGSTVGDLELAYQGSTKLTCEATGVDITGALTVNGSPVTGGGVDLADNNAWTGTNSYADSVDILGSATTFQLMEVAASDISARIQWHNDSNNKFFTYSDSDKLITKSVNSAGTSTHTLNILYRNGQRKWYANNTVVMELSPSTGDFTVNIGDFSLPAGRAEIARGELILGTGSFNSSLKMNASGSGQDCFIGTDGADLHIRTSGSSGVSSGSPAIKVTSDSSVSLYLNGSKKLETAATGVDVTGDLEVTGSINGVRTIAGGSFRGATGTNYFGCNNMLKVSTGVYRTYCNETWVSVNSQWDRVIPVVGALSKATGHIYLSSRFAQNTQEVKFYFKDETGAAVDPTAFSFEIRKID